MTPELELPDDADAKRETLRTLDTYRRQVLREAASIVQGRSGNDWGYAPISTALCMVADELRALADG